jgi:hypothetical protein
MTSPLCFSHFAIIVSSFMVLQSAVFTSSTNDKGVYHTLSTVHEIPKLCFPDWKQTWSSPAHTNFKAWV